MTAVTQSPTSTIEPRTTRPKNRLFAWLKRLVLWLSIGIISLTAVGATYQTIASKLDQRIYPPPGQRIDVGGYRLHSYCIGANTDGRPTVILEAGLGSMSSAWAHVQPEIAKVSSAAILKVVEAARMGAALK